jgi:hypothetical protein
VNVLRPNLDDRTYAQLVAEATARIPAVAPDWTDHNPTDPGITLVELFAWLSEALIYRTDQIPDERYDAFLRLLRGSGWTRSAALDSAIAETLTLLRTPWRAATAADIERLVLLDWPASADAATLGPGDAVRRVQSVPSVNVEADQASRSQPAPGHLSILIVPDRAATDAAGSPPAPSPELRQALWTWLEPRRLLGVRHHVAGPDYVAVSVTARLVLRNDYAPPQTAQSGVLTDQTIADQAGRDAIATIERHFDALNGGADGTGWPFGRNVYLSELYQLLDGLTGVDYVDGVRFVGLPADRALVVNGDVIGARLDPHELVVVSASDDPSNADRLVVVPGTAAGGA